MLAAKSPDLALPSKFYHAQEASLRFCDRQNEPLGLGYTYVCCKTTLTLECLKRKLENSLGTEDKEELEKFRAKWEHKFDTTTAPPGAPKVIVEIHRVYNHGSQKDPETPQENQGVR
jgi:hypothetical protein